MIKITVELQSAIDGHKEILGEGIIYNDATGTDSRGNYKVILSKKGGLKSKKKGSTQLPITNIWKRGEVKDFPRLRLGGWDLLYRALGETVGDRNKEA